VVSLFQLDEQFEGLAAKEREYLLELIHEHTLQFQNEKDVKLHVGLF
jgi:hypothetical protein